MEANQNGNGLLDLVIRPGFCVTANKIVQVNSAAQALLIVPGTDVRELLLTGTEEYAAFEGGCLYLKLNLSPNGCGASVTRVDDMDVFLLEQETDNAELRAFALAARELRSPLTSVMLSAEHLLSAAAGDAASQEHAARLNRGLHQLLRIIGNMSDAGHCISTSRQEAQNISEVFAEIFENAQSLVSQAGISLAYRSLVEDVLCLADREQLERAVWNVLSNAVKFTPKGGTIEAELVRRGKLLRLSILDSGSGIAEAVLSSVYTRYLRQPGIEDSRFGLGLGMVMIHSAAAAHGGTVLIDQAQGKGTRVTLTMAIRQDTSGSLRSPVMRVDYAGERDHGLIELADTLPVSVYQKGK